MGLDFGKALARCLEQVPRGRAVTCGAVARALGDDRAARGVAAWILEHPETPGGHRVVRRDGSPILRELRTRDRDGLPVDSNHIVSRLRNVGYLGRLRAEQRRLAKRVVEEGEHGPIELIAGVDVSYEGSEMYAAATNLNAADLEPVQVVTVRRQACFPYVPTYLAYREFPAIREAVGRLLRRPDVLLVDGHGRLHPALFGVACYAGIQLDLPTIGIAKHLLAGKVRYGKSDERTAWPVTVGDRIRGYAWIPPGRSRPIFISVGHLISLEKAVHVARSTTRRGYPEPLRIADRVSREMKRNEKREKGAAR